MNQKEAFAVYSRVSAGAGETIERLMKWDSGLTVKQNAQALKLEYSNAIMFKGRYGLKSAKEPYRRKRDGYVILTLPQNLMRAKKLKGIGFTFEEIGRVFNVSKQRVEQVLKNRTPLKGKGE